MSAPLLFVAADPLECRDWVARWTEVRKVSLAVRWARKGKWRGREVAAIANGSGSERAFAAVVLAGKVSAVCNIGLCGALDENLRVGDIFVATEIRSGNRKWDAMAPGAAASAPAKSGVVASIDRVAETAQEKRGLRVGGASVVEMEAAGAAGAAEEMSLPFYCVRVVSDLASEDFANDFNAALAGDGTFSIARLVVGAFASPGKRFGELIRMKHRADMASKKLGEFLADCTF